MMQIDHQHLLETVEFIHRTIPESPDENFRHLAALTSDAEAELSTWVNETYRNPVFLAKRRERLDRDRGWHLGSF